MGYSVKQRALFAAVETGGIGAGTFALSNGGGDYTPLRVYDIETDTDQEFYEQPVQDIRFYTEDYAQGPKMGKVRFKAVLRGPSTTVPTAAFDSTALKDLGMVLKACGLAVEYGCAPTTEAGASDTSVINLTSGTGLTSGQIIAVQRDSDSLYEAVPIGAYSSNVAYLAKKLSSAPKAGGGIYGCINLAPATEWPSNYSLRLMAIGRNPTDAEEHYACRGMLKTVTIANGWIIGEFEFESLVWQKATHTLTDVATIAAPSGVSAHRILVSVSACPTWTGYDKSVGTNLVPALHTTLRIAKDGFALNTGRQISKDEVWNASLTDADGEDFTLTDEKPTLAYQPHFALGGWTTIENNQAVSFMMHQRGLNVGAGVALWVPRALIKEGPKKGDANGVKTMPIERACGRPVDADKATYLEGLAAEDPQWSDTAVRNTPWRLALGC